MMKMLLRLKIIQSHRPIPLKVLIFFVPVLKKIKRIKKSSAIFLSVFKQTKAFQLQKKRLFESWK